MIGKMWHQLCKAIICIPLILFFPVNVYAGNELSKFLIVGVENRVHITNLKTGSIVHSFPVINDFLVKHLSDCNKIVLIENSKEFEIARLNDIIQQISKGKIPVKLQREKPDYLVYGYLNDVGIKTSGQGIMLPTVGASAGGESQTVNVRLSVIIVNAHTGKEVFVATGRGQSGSIKVQVGYQMHAFKIGSKVAVEGALHKALYKAVRQIADKIIKEA